MFKIQNRCFNETHYEIISENSALLKIVIEL
jgi:hypothetical protein